MSQTSTRQASPPPVKRWPYYLGDAVLLGTAFAVLAFGETPPTSVGMIIVSACLLFSVGLLVAPYLLEYDARVRLAEAAARDHAEHQARRLIQAGEQLAHTLSRGQSTEEQLGRVLGTLEDLTEKLSSQSDDLAQAIARSGDREIAEMRGEIERLTRDRDQQLASLNGKVASIANSIQEAHSATKLSIAAHAKAVDDIHLRLDAIGARVDEFSRAFNHFRATVPSLVDRVAKPSASPRSGASKSEATPHSSPAPRDFGARSKPTEPAEDASRKHAVEEAAPARAATETKSTAARSDPAAREQDVSRPASKPEVIESRSSQPTPPPAHKQAHANEQNAELPLEGMPPPRQPMKLSRRDLAGATSIVATAYIGIGNKLYLRGEGPGLTWERGVPMQFLAIGKWGWTTTDAGAPVTCRIFRNDETPMLDADVVIAPGEKAEITPRF